MTFLRRIHWDTTALLMLLLSAATFGAVLPTAASWGECHVDWCQPEPFTTQQPVEDALADALVVEAAGCVPMAQWEGAVPTSFIVRSVTTGQVKEQSFDRAWDTSHKGLVWILGACSDV